MTQTSKNKTHDAEDKYAPLMEKIRKFSESIPESALESVPTDLAENHDHYIYDLPKKSEDGIAYAC